MKSRLIVDALFGSKSGLYAVRKNDQEQIVSAAIAHEGNVYLGAYHLDAMLEAGLDPNEDSNWEAVEQGFYTNKGRFVSREEAVEIAKNSGQIDADYRELDAADL